MWAVCYFLQCILQQHEKHWHSASKPSEVGKKSLQVNFRYSSFVSVRLGKSKKMSKIPLA
jgi:hypothetical protein